MQSNSLLLLCTASAIGVVIIAIFSLKGIIMATQNAIVERINAAAERAEKAKTEIVAAVEALKVQIDSAQASNPEIESALGRLDTAVGSLDELNPDTFVDPDAPVNPVQPA